MRALAVHPLYVVSVAAVGALLLHSERAAAYEPAMTNATYDRTMELAVSLVFMCVILPINLVFVYLFASHMQQQPIRGRQPRVVLVAAAFQFLYTLNISVEHAYDPNRFPCLAIWIPAHVWIHGCALVYIYRTWYLYVAFTRAHQALADYERKLMYRYAARGPSLDKAATGAARWAAPGSSTAAKEVELRRVQVTNNNKSDGGGQDKENHLVVPPTPTSAASPTHAALEVSEQLLPATPPQTRVSRGSYGSEDVFLPVERDVVSFFFSRWIWRKEKQKWLIAFWAFIFILMLLPLFISAGVDSQLCGDGNSYIYTEAIVLLFIVAAFIYLAFRLRAVSDGFGITVELKACSVFALMALTCWIVGELAVLDFNRNTFALSSWGALLFLNIMMNTSLGLPVYIAVYAPPLIHSPPDLLQAGSLEGVLSTPEGYQSLADFFATEFSVENILFWKAVEDFKRDWTADDESAPSQRVSESSEEALLKSVDEYKRGESSGSLLDGGRSGSLVRSASAGSVKKGSDRGSNAGQLQDAAYLAAKRFTAAEDVFREYISKDSDHCVYLPGLIEEPIVKQLQDRAVTFNIFDDAQRHIVSLIKLDGYQRYARSPFYAKYITHIKVDMAKSKYLQRMDMA